MNKGKKIGLAIGAGVLGLGALALGVIRHGNEGEDNYEYENTDSYDEDVDVVQEETTEE